MPPSRQGGAVQGRRTPSRSGAYPVATMRATCVVAALLLAHPARGQTAEELAETCGKAEDAKCQYIAVETCPENVEYSKRCPEKCGKCPKATQPPTEKVTAAPSPSGPPSPPPSGVSLRVSSRLCKTHCLLARIGSSWWATPAWAA